MDNIGVVGTSYRTASVEALAEATLPSDFQPRHFNELAHLAGFSEFVYLGTCNRVEFYVAGNAEPAALGRDLFSFIVTSSGLPPSELEPHLFVGCTHPVGRDRCRHIRSETFT